MDIKDYYTILEVKPSATEQDIKTSFRRLALKYHPDKNNGDALSEALFREIQEAYEILSDPEQREAYNYKRWYNRSTGEGFFNRPVTPATLLAESEKLQHHVAGMNIFQVDHQVLNQHIRQILTENNIAILQQAGDQALNRNIIRSLLSAASPLPVKYAQPVESLLVQLAGADSKALQDILRFMKEKKGHEQWDRYKWIVVVVLTALICWLMAIVAD